MKIKYRVWESSTKRWLDPIYKGYEGIIFEPQIVPNGELCFRCMGVPGLEDGYYHSSYLEYGFGCKFEIYWDMIDNIKED